MFIKPVDALPKQEELKLIRKAQQGDEAAMNTLIAANILFVYKIAHNVLKLTNYAHDMEDLVAIGVEGLFKGIQSFKPENFNVKLITYSGDAIQQTMFKYINSLNSSGALSLQDPINDEGDTVADIIKDPSESVEDTLTKTFIKGVKHQLLSLNSNIIKLGDRYIDMTCSIKNQRG